MSSSSFRLQSRRFVEATDNSSSSFPASSPLDDWNLPILSSQHDVIEVPMQSQLLEETSHPLDRHQQHSNGASAVDAPWSSSFSTTITATTTAAIAIISTEQVIRRIEDQVMEIIQVLDQLDSSSSSSAEQQQQQPQQQQSSFLSLHNKRFANMSQCRTFTSMLMVLAFCHALLLAKRTTTTREVYYFYVTHFRSQKECDAIILDCAKLLGIPRSSLGLVASPKGWFCGCIEIERNGTVIDGRTLVQGLPITREWLMDPSQRDFSILSCTAKCIVVVEKEGVYNRLSEDGFYDTYPCILVTGKGFPDLATRALVHTIHTECGALPVYGLCDCNPYGISVLQTYQFGGERMGCDGGDRYSVPIQWLGLRPSHVEALRPQLAVNVLQQLTELDIKRLEKLCQPYHPFHDNHKHKDERLEELHMMQANGYKVELEALHWLGMDFLSKWVLQILVRHDDDEENDEQNDDDEEDETSKTRNRLMII